MEDLYQHDLTGLAWTKPCGDAGWNGEGGGDCMESAPLPGGGMAIRDSKLGEDSPVLRFTAVEVAAFKAS